MSGINKRVNKVRKSKKLTQEDLAQKLGYKTSTYSQMERSGKIPCEMLVKIAEILETDVRYFLYGEDYPNKEKIIIVRSKPRVEEPKTVETEEFRDEEERYLILTYRNLRPKEKQAAYSLFMQHFNMNIIFKKRKEERQKRLKVQNNPD